MVFVCIDYNLMLLIVFKSNIILRVFILEVIFNINSNIIRVNVNDDF